MESPSGLVTNDQGFVVSHLACNALMVSYMLSHTGCLLHVAIYMSSKSVTNGKNRPTVSHCKEKSLTMSRFQQFHDLRSCASSNGNETSFTRPRLRAPAEELHVVCSLTTC